MQISRGKFDRLRYATAGSTPSISMDRGLRGHLSARPNLSPPHIRFVFLDSPLCSALPSDAPPGSPPCPSLTLRLHLAGYRTFPSKLSNMLGIQKPPDRWPGDGAASGG